MCPKPKVKEPAPIPDPAPPLAETATGFKRDVGAKKKGRASSSTARKGSSDLRVDLNIPGAGVGLQV